jgi:hypothetical protein
MKVQFTAEDYKYRARLARALHRPDDSECFEHAAADRERLEQIRQWATDMDYMSHNGWNYFDAKREVRAILGDPQ